MAFNYLILLAGIYLIYSSIFKIKNDLSLRLLGLALAIDGILISIARILSIIPILRYPIYVFGIVWYIILTYKVWKVRKDPKKKFAAYYWLIGMPCIIVIAVLMVLFWK